jgi:release factor glutamine methyltransferase
MNLKDILNNYKETLKHIYDEQEISATFKIVFEAVSGLKKSQFTILQEVDLSGEEAIEYNRILQRLANSEPLQYILAEAYFYGLKFNVNQNVLIPRPETEELVELALNNCKLLKDDCNILDIGTGSGCIAVTMKYHLKKANVSALDVNPEALEVAMQNAEQHQTKINFIEADIRNYYTEQRFDMIISNPPYITAKELSAMDRNVTDFEPHLALFVADENPLEFYIAIADFASQTLNNTGSLLLEINANYGRETVEMLLSKNFKDIHILKDMQGKERFITARKLD